MRHVNWPNFLLLVCLLALQFPNRVAADSYHIIVCGSGGDTVYAQQFESWGYRLRSVLTDQFGHPAHRVMLFTESGERASGISSRATLGASFRQLGHALGDKDDVFLYLVGHGSYRQGIGKLNVPGKDLSAEDLSKWLEPWRAHQIVVIQTASASASFMNVLSGKGRVIVTSTRSEEERNATRYMEYFLQALEDGSADQNRDERISVLEVSRQAAFLTESWYVGQGYLATENALLDDNGDGKGTRLTKRDTLSSDGELARTGYLYTWGLRERVSAKLLDEYARSIVLIEELIKKKGDLDPATYGEKLEILMIKVARLHRSIRQSGGN
ncbi:MAG: hypothetical protein O3B73_12650 [bacterium]|nr:hypothetical protein [bacterium]